MPSSLAAARSELEKSLFPTDPFFEAGTPPPSDFRHDDCSAESALADQIVYEFLPEIPPNNAASRLTPKGFWQIFYFPSID